MNNDETENKTPEAIAAEIMKAFVEVLYEANGTGSGANDCALLAVKFIIESAPLRPEYVGEGYKLHSDDVWADVKTHIGKYV
tara:strand:+ start:1112 stop:1357 length:246 start_codon:yes stop_codon:yes gene_type:complete